MNKAKYIIASVLSGAIAFAYIFYFINTIMGFVDLSSIDGGGYITATIILSVISLLVAIAAFIILLIASIKLAGKIRYGNPTFLFLLGLVFVSLEKVISTVGAMIILQSYAPGISVDGGSIVVIAFLVISLILFIVCAALSKGKTKGVVGIVGSIGSIFFLVPLFISISGGLNSLSLIYLVILLLAYIGVFVYFVFDTVTDYTFTPVESSETKEQEVNVNKVESTYTNTNTEQALLRLKRLLDQGVISEEEYNEKRKKYVDSL